MTRVKIIGLIFLLCINRLVTTSGNLTDFYQDEDKIILIHILPSSQDEELSGWNHSQLGVLHDAKQIALDYINNSPAILPGVTLDIVDVSTDDCARGYSLHDLVETFRQISEKKRVVGVLGLYCSRVTGIISTHLSHKKWGYLQLSASTSPLLRNKDRYPYLFRTITSSVSFNNAVLKMMDEFEWKNISIIYDFSDIFFRSTAIDFAKRVEQREDLSLQEFYPIRDNLNMNEFLRNLVKKESKVTYFSVTHKESSDIICDAYHNGYSWPEHVYIFADDSLAEILNNTDKCSRKQLLEASEGVILLLYQLSHANYIPNDHSINRMDYKNKLSETITTSKMKDFANVLFDQIWTFAFAINNSYDAIQSSGKEFFNGSFQVSSRLRSQLIRNFKNVSFEGVSGRIKFTDKQEVLSKINIYQVQSGSEILIGTFYPSEEESEDNLTIHYDKLGPVPTNLFEIRHDAIPLYLFLVVGICHLLLFMSCVGIMLYLMYWKNAPEIKSLSVRVSFVTLLGCFLITLSSIFYNLESSGYGSSRHLTLFCNFESWLLFCGIHLTIIGLLFRLFRIFVIFRYAMSMKMELTDRQLAVYIGLISLIPLLTLATRTGVDYLVQEPVRKFLFTNHDPHYTEYYYCFSRYDTWWSIIYMSWIAFLLAFLLFLAVKTRHIRYHNFKDTKKVGAFIFIVILLFSTLVPLEIVLREGKPMISYLLKSLVTLLIPLSCLVLQYFPKIFPVLRKNSGLSIKKFKIACECIIL